MALPWRPIKSETPSKKLDWTPKLFGGMFIPTWFSGGPDLSRWKLLKLKCEWILGYQSKSSVGRCRGSKIEIIKTHRSNFTVQNVRKKPNDVLQSPRWLTFSRPNFQLPGTHYIFTDDDTSELLTDCGGLRMLSTSLGLKESFFKESFFNVHSSLTRCFLLFVLQQIKFPFFRFFLLYQVTYFSRKTKLEVSHQVVASFWAVVVVARRRVTW